VKVGDGQIEMYDHSRFFTVTGRAYRGSSLQVEDHAGDLLKLYGGLTKRKRSKWKLQPEADGRIRKGKQHLTLVSIAGTLRRRRICEEAIESCLQLVNTRQCTEPGPAENISKLVRSTRGWGRGA